MSSDEESTAELVNEDQNTLDILQVDIDKNNERVREVKLPDSIKLPIRLLKSSSSKTAKLLGNELEENEIKGTSRWHNFFFNEIIYIESIEVITFGYPDGHEIIIQTCSANGSWNKEKTLKITQNKILLSIKGMRSGFRFEPKTKFSSDIKITAVNVIGLEASDLSDAINSIVKIEDFSQKIEESGEKIFIDTQKVIEERRAALELKESLDSEISTRTTEIGRLIEEQTKSQESITEAERRVEVLSGRQADVSEKIERLEGTIEQRVQEREALAQQVSEKSSELKSLQDDINLFPSEIKGYVSQGTKNANLYALLCIIPFLVLIILGIRLLNNAEDLVQSFNLDNNIDVLEILLSRAPYVIVSFAFLALVSAVLTFLLTEIVNINRRKQEMYKINIIATDVSDASGVNLELSDDERMAHLSALKIQMLRDHLKHTLSEDFHFKFMSFRKRKEIGHNEEEVNKSPNDKDAPDNNEMSDVMDETKPSE